MCDVRGYDARSLSHLVAGHVQLAHLPQAAGKDMRKGRRQVRLGDIPYKSCSGFGGTHWIWHKAWKETSNYFTVLRIWWFGCEDVTAPLQLQGGEVSCWGSSSPPQKNSSQVSLHNHLGVCGNIRESKSLCCFFFVYSKKRKRRGTKAAHLR